MRSYWRGYALRTNPQLTSERFPSYLSPNDMTSERFPSYLLLTRIMRVKRAVIKKLGLVDPASSVHRSSLGGGGWLYH
uniref:Uncharacterized protein n=1 Tax=Picea glauca TaxID=3330 RepID=A0A117NHM5_PICGL|nr:hypothetical protein ABT39_MTgene4608 [Picea glauca]